MSEPVAVLGSGLGALAVARGLAHLGRPVVLVADRPLMDDPGLPARLLGELGREGSLQPDEALGAVRRRRDDHVARLSARVESTEGLQLILARPRFLEPYLLELRGSELDRMESRQIVIATGSEPVRLQIPGLPPERTLTHETLYDLERPPAHLAIVGGGTIALESACAFARLGSRVTLVVRSDRLLARESASVSIAMMSALQRQGIEVRLERKPFLYADGQLQLRPEGVLEKVDAVLLAVGRRPRVSQLDLDRAGLTAGRHGLEVDSWCRTLMRGLYAVGEVTGTSRFNPMARAQARRLLQHLTRPWLPERPLPHVLPAVTFSDPEVASVRLENPVPETRREVLWLGLSELERELTEGFLELEVEQRTGQLQGATLVAPHASESLAFLTLAMQERIPLARLGCLVLPSPTVSEAVQRLAERFSC